MGLFFWALEVQLCLLLLRDSVGYKNSHPIEISYYGRNFTENTVNNQQNSPHNHHRHGFPFGPSTAFIQWIGPIRHVGGHPQGLAEDGYAGFCLIRQNNSLNNWILLLLVFSTNRYPAIANGCRNGIHRRRRQRAPIIYDKFYKNSIKKNNLTRF